MTASTKMNKKKLAEMHRNFEGGHSVEMPLKKSNDTILPENSEQTWNMD